MQNVRNVSTYTYIYVYIYIYMVYVKHVLSAWHRVFRMSGHAIYLYVYLCVFIDYVWNTHVYTMYTASTMYIYILFYSIQTSATAEGAAQSVQKSYIKNCQKNTGQNKSAHANVNRTVWFANLCLERMTKKPPWAVVVSAPTFCWRTCHE
jgi:hypothetical protein